MTIFETISSVLILAVALHTGIIFVAGQCTDKNSQCSAWANRGECTNNPLYMLQNCAKSCQVCSGCVNIYGDAYCTKYVGDCWHYNYWKTMVKNCKKTCVCTCCPTKPVTLPTTATIADTTTALNVSTADQTTEATTLYSTTIDERRTTTLASQITHSSSGTEANASVLQTTSRTIYATEQDLSVTADPKGTNDVVLAAIIAGVVAFIGVLGLVMFWYWKRKRSGSLNQPKFPALPPVQNDCIPTEEIIWLERQPRRDSSKPLAVSLDTTGANESYNQAFAQDSSETPVAESISRSPYTPFYHVLEEPDSSATSRERVLSTHYEQTSEHLRADSDYDALQEARAAQGLPVKARENEAVYEVASPKGLCNIAPSNKNLDDNDEYCYSYTAVGQDLSVKDVENRPQEAPKTEDSNYHALEGPNTGYQAIERAPPNGYTPMDGITDLTGYQALKKPAKSVYQPLKKTNQPPRRAFTRK